MNDLERPRVKATIINRFKGDITHFAKGITILEEITGVPVAGIVPYISLSLPEEDGGSTTAYVPDDNLDNQFDLIAGHIRKSLNMDLVYKILSDGMGS
jgi:adenosylcobyric acid synthase